LEDTGQKMRIEELFKIGMKRDIPELLDPPPTGYKLNIGSGNQIVPGFHNFDLPYWDAEKDRIPYEDSAVGAIYAFHLLEHLSDPRPLIREALRVLKKGGIFNIVVPYYTSQMQAHDLDHKTCFCEETWKQLLSSEYYSKDKISGFKIGTNIIIGVVERNLALMTQLIKV
jgi:SAM-dependent methyltransferase